MLIITDKSYIWEVFSPKELHFPSALPEIETYTAMQVIFHQGGNSDSISARILRAAGSTQ